MHPRRFQQLDVFANGPFSGNPLAVVHAADGLDDVTLAAFARWTNLSETTYLLPPRHGSADYQVRIFTPGGELPFAGHPTLGSCAAWLRAGGVPQDANIIVQECGVGLVRIRRDGERLAFAAPPLQRTGPLDDAVLARICKVLALQPGDIRAHQWVDNGPGWCAVMLESGAAVRALIPDIHALGELKLGVIGPQAPGGDSDYEVRAFAPALGSGEDPVTGSLNAGLALWLIGAGIAPSRYVVAQGGALRHDGRVHVERDGDDVWIGGLVTSCIDGTIAI